jgi:hypothetical protein
MFDMEGTGVFAYRSVRIPMDGDRLPKRATLSIYRLPWCHQFCFWLDQGSGHDTLLNRLQQGFQQMGGVPQHLLVRAVKPFAGRKQPEVVWARTFQRFCAHYRCQPNVYNRPIAPHTPWFNSIENILNSRDWTTVEECQQELTTLAKGLSQGRSPDLRALLPLPTQPFAAHHDAPCRVAADGFLRYEGDYYSVPPYCTGRTVWVRRTPANQLLRFYSEDENLVTQHVAGHGQGKVHLRLEHFGLTPPEQSQLILTWKACFPEDERFLGHLLAQRKLGAAQTLRAILDLTKRFRRKRLRQIFGQCERYNNYSHRFIQGLLEADQTSAPITSVPPTPAQELLF